MVLVFQILLVLAIPLDFHPFHVSVCEIDHNNEERTLQVTHRIFLDDLEAGIRKAENNENFDIYEPSDTQLRDEWVKDYIMNRFSIVVDDQKLSGNYLGNEIDSDVMYAYIEYEKVPDLKKITVNNSILTEIYDDQANIIHVTYEEEIKSLKLDKKDPEGVIEFL